MAKPCLGCRHSSGIGVEISAKLLFGLKSSSKCLAQSFRHWEPREAGICSVMGSEQPILPLACEVPLHWASRDVYSALDIGPELCSAQSVPSIALYAVDTELSGEPNQQSSELLPMIPYSKPR